MKKQDTVADMLINEVYVKTSVAIHSAHCDEDGWNIFVDELWTEKDLRSVAFILSKYNKEYPLSYFKE